MNIKNMNTIFFFSPDKPYGYMSNWYPSRITLEFTNLPNQVFVFENVEQAMMAGKAMLTGDIQSFNKILTVSDPKRVKTLGRKVSNFNQELWDKYKKLIVKTAITAKFLQNKPLLDLLLSTGNSYLAEDSPNDKVWGIGTKSEKVKASRTWKGQNLLGIILMEVRNELRLLGI